MMVIKFARFLIYCFCFTGFLIQCWNILFKFSEGTTTTITSIVKHKEGRLDFPRFSICLDPPTTMARMSELGLNPKSWDIKDDEYTEWPITSLNQSNLWDLSMYSFKEVFKSAQIGYSNHEGREFNFVNLPWKETNTWYNGKCFTFFGDKVSSKFNAYVNITLNSVFAEGKGNFRVFIYDVGMELSLVNQWWLTPNLVIFDIAPGSYADISIERYLKRKMPIYNGLNASCHKDWNSLDFYNCLDQLTAKAREPFHCRSPFDLALNQSALAKEKPVCTTLDDIKSIIHEQTKLFWDIHEGKKKCAENCDLVSYKPSISSNKIFGRNFTKLFIYYLTFHTVLEEEILAYGWIGTVSSLGGSLGLFLGFSFLGVGLTFIKKLQKVIQDKKATQVA